MIHVTRIVRGPSPKQDNGLCGRVKLIGNGFAEQ